MVHFGIGQRNSGRRRIEHVEPEHERGRRAVGYAGDTVPCRCNQVRRDQEPRAVCGDWLIAEWFRCAQRESETVKKRVRERSGRKRNGPLSA